MLQLRSYPKFFKALKILQWLISFGILMIEVTQIVVYYKIPLPKSFFSKQDLYDGEVKYWYYFVILITLIGIGYYLTKFHRFWGMGPNIVIDLVFFFLWLAAGLANLVPVYKGSNLTCPLINLKSQNLELHCLYYIVSLILGWVNTFFFLMTSIICQIIRWEKAKWEEEKSGLSRKSRDYRSYGPMDSKSNLHFPITIHQNNITAPSIN
ncbi:9568_t:CDS:2 [Funneliformis mosseae]|uniref:9568_t:CDS:1 n=1 Tax=Funneliformis mosseae TaxID=27381 RepID=A0A9N9D1G7_FUNMO|nr:9568_t:CDS:2 [Funneliformis mosseae]